MATLDYIMMGLGIAFVIFIAWKFYDMHREVNPGSPGGSGGVWTPPSGGDNPRDEIDSRNNTKKT